MDETYYLEQNTTINKIILFFRLSLLFNFFNSLIFCYRYLDNSDIVVQQYFLYVFLYIIKTIHFSHYMFIIYRNYDRMFINIRQFVEWEKNIGFKRYYFNQISLMLEVLVGAVIMGLSWPIGIDLFTNKQLILYRFSILIIHIITMFQLLILILLAISVFCCNLLCIIHSEFQRNRNNVRIVELPTLIEINITEECSICLDSTVETEWTRTICGHQFHKKCLIKWIESNRTCPNCRMNINL